MGNTCACECLQDQEKKHQIEVNNNTYHKDYTQPGNFKGGNQFLLLENSDSEEKDNKLRFQTTKEQKYQQYDGETADPDKLNGNVNNEDKNGNDGLKQDNEVILDDNRIQYQPVDVEEEDVVCGSTTVKNVDQDNLTKKSKVQTYAVSTYKHYQEGNKKENTHVDTLRSEGEGNYINSYLIFFYLFRWQK